MIIRYAEITDFQWLKEHDKHISDEILKTKLTANEVFIVQEDKKLLGWLRYNLFWDNVPFINLLFVLDKYRYRGIGKKLLDHWEKDMREKGYLNALTSTQSNEEAQHFYRKMGYTEIGGFKYLDDPLEILFHKKL